MIEFKNTHVDNKSEKSQTPLKLFSSELGITFNSIINKTWRSVKIEVY